MYTAISGLFGLVSGVLSKYFTSEDDKEKLEQAMAEIKALPELQQSQQINVNNSEAQSKSAFVAGARPLEEYMFGIASFYCLFIQPFFSGIGIHLPIIPQQNMYMIFSANCGLMGFRYWVNNK